MKPFKILFPIIQYPGVFHSWANMVHLGKCKYHLSSLICVYKGHWAENKKKKSPVTKFNVTLRFPDMKTAQWMHFALKFPSAFWVFQNHWKYLLQPSCLASLPNKLWWWQITITTNQLARVTFIHLVSSRLSHFYIKQVKIGVGQSGFWVIRGA